MAPRPGATYIPPVEKLTIDVWSDIACPWCYIGKRRLEGALRRFAHRDEVDVVWHAVELDPNAPPANPEPTYYVERLAKKYGTSRGQAEAMIKRVVDTAAAEGLDFRFDRIRSGNTFDGHRLIHFALERDKQDALKERLLRAYFTEGEAMSDRVALARLAGEVGLDVDEATAVLETDAHASDVRDDEGAAADIGITGVPFFVIGGRYAVSGAQPADGILEIIERASRERAPTQSSLDEGGVCGPDGCS